MIIIVTGVSKGRNNPSSGFEAPGATRYASGFGTAQTRLRSRGARSLGRWPRTTAAAGADRRAWPHPALFVQMFADLRKFQQLFIGETMYEGYTDSQGNVFDGGMGGFDIDMGGGK